MLTHIAREHLAISKETWNSRVTVICFCGAEISANYRSDGVSKENVEPLISPLREHIAGRRNPGVITARLELHEIHDHYHRFMLGITPKEK